eukprot:6133288-Alexandrium_andersonii.AAC.1
MGKLVVPALGHNGKPMELALRNTACPSESAAHCGVWSGAKCFGAADTILLCHMLHDSAHQTCKHYVVCAPEHTAIHGQSPGPTNKKWAFCTRGASKNMEARCNIAACELCDERISQSCGMRINREKWCIVFVNFGWAGLALD